MSDGINACGPMETWSREDQHRETQPSPVDDDLVERALSIYTEYCRAKIPLRENDRVEAMAAVILLVQQDSNARWEKAVADELRKVHSWYEHAIVNFLHAIHARIEAKPKTPEERVVLMPRDLAAGKYDVTLDGKWQITLPQKAAQTFRLGLIVELSKENRGKG
jgi:hypothetical protein